MCEKVEFEKENVKFYLFNQNSSIFEISLSIFLIRLSLYNRNIKPYYSIILCVRVEFMKNPKGDIFLELSEC